METKVIQVDNGNMAEIKAVADCVEAGGLAVFPTETVYGIACAVRPGSIDRLNDLKQRDGQKHYTLHIGDKKNTSDYVGKINPIAQKLIDNGWPGPITIVFELSGEDVAELSKKIDAFAAKILYKDNSIGIRCPDNTIARELLSNIKSPVVAPSANAAGGEPAVNADEAMAVLNGKVETIIDGGGCEYKKSSTVVKIGRHGWGVLRKGVYDEAQIRKMLEIQILFVCTGNTCRSPMAEGFGQKFIAEKLGCKVDQLEGMGYKVVSAGLMAINGVRASDEAVRFCRERGVDIAGHLSQGMSRELIGQSDYIFALGENHRSNIVALSPEAAGKCRLLDEGRSVADPIGGGKEVYDVCGKEIEKAVEKRICEFL